ncbi:DUF418 domain-containing protein [Legionella sp. D16C41]|uniref:DUF418 domain-containing protein n=1 Tax=Legionella sp. D16C41 TaxID=3402688 RepID=UPI003AF52B09
MPRERIQSLDVIRGFALAGIYLTNILYFSGAHFAPTKLHEAGLLSQFDSIIYFFVVTFIDNICYTIFCFLFGIGFYLFYNKANNFKVREQLFLRRLGGLFLIGISHALIWYGDILFTYALIGLSFFWFNKLSMRRLKQIIWLLLFISAVIIPLFFCLLDYFSLLPVVTAHPEAHESMPGITPENFFTTLSQGNYRSIFNLNLHMLYWKIIFHFYSGKLVNIMAFFALGLYIAKTRLSQQSKNSFLFNSKRQLILAALLGLFLSFTHAWLKLFILKQINLNGLAILNNLLSLSGSILMALVYIEFIAKITHYYPAFSRFIAAYGRLALTNYLLQTVFSLVIFYSFGLALYGVMSMTACILLSIIFVLFQIFLSNLWLKYYEYGPVEWLWRMFTYKSSIRIIRI